MDKRHLGTLEVSAIGLGCMGLSANYGDPVDTEHGISLIRAAHDQGVTFFDTAEAYGPFANETLVGEALEPIRDQVVIATKFGFGFDDRPGGSEQPTRATSPGRRADPAAAADRPHRPALPAPRRPGRADRGRRRHRQGADRRGQGRPLRAVGGERRHHPPRPRRPARHGGAERVLDLGARSRSSGAPVCEELGIGFVPWSPLGQGFLTGTSVTSESFAANDIRTRFPRFTPEALGQPADRRPGQRDRRPHAGHPGTGRAGMAAREVARASCRSPAPARSTVCARTLPRSRSASPTPTSPTSTPAPNTSTVTGARGSGHENYG